MHSRQTPLSLTGPGNGSALAAEFSCTQAAASIAGRWYWYDIEPAGELFNKKCDMVGPSSHIEPEEQTSGADTHVKWCNHCTLDVPEV